MRSSRSCLLGFLVTGMESASRFPSRHWEVPWNQHGCVPEYWWGQEAWAGERPEYLLSEERPMQVTFPSRWVWATLPT